MQHDPVRVADVRSWLDRASRDLAAGDHVLQANPPLTGDAVFHAQQTVEKALKAFLVWYDQPFRKTHSLEELGEQCLEYDASLRSVIDSVVPLTEYAWRFRYPGEALEPPFEEAQGALAIARSAYGAILDRLPEDTHS